MKLIDTHCHLDFPDYKDDLDKVIDRALSSGVVRMIVPGVNIKSSVKAIGLAKKYPAIFATVGIHPHDADTAGDTEISKVRDIAISNDKVVAIGEIGLDNYRKYSKPENQKKLFRGCLEIAKELDLPVILHNREADKDFLDTLKEMSPFTASGVVHCFSADVDLLQELLFCGFHISFTGNITFEKAGDLRDLIKNVPLEKLLLETDSPFIAPVPVRGKRNEPENLRYLLDIYKEVYELSSADIARVTTHNANRLFCLGIEEEPVIVYPIRNSLYINITNRCTNRCTFCTRQYSDYVMGHNLKLDAEPTANDIIEATKDNADYSEIVFCGYGEPTLRLSTVKEVASYVKKSGCKVRLTSNGEGNIINGRDITAELKGLIDKVSVSLNAPDEKGHDHLCQSVFGEKSFEAILSFIKGCRQHGIEIEITCLDIIGEEAVEKCRQIAKDLDADFRLRHLDAVG